MFPRQKKILILPQSFGNDSLEVAVRPVPYCRAVVALQAKQTSLSAISEAQLVAALFSKAKSDSFINLAVQGIKGDNKPNAPKLFANQSDDERRRRLQQSVGGPRDTSSPIQLGGSGPFGRRLR